MVANNLAFAVVVATLIAAFASGKSVYWISNNAGLFSQFLQTKIMYYLVTQKIGSNLIVAPIQSKHYGDVPVMLCDFFSFPSTLTCGDPPKTMQCFDELPTDYETNPEFCYSGNVRFGAIDKARKYVIKAVDSIDLPLKFNPKNLERYEEFKKSMGVESGSNFTVVHWRRGDQGGRCEVLADVSVNCDDAKHLLKKIQQLTTDKFIFVATNEPQDSEEMDYLRRFGVMTFSSVGGGKYKDLNLFEVLTIEVSLMQEATTFLGWGTTEVNDVVEHERWKSGKTHCIDQVEVQYEEQITWCAMKGISPMNIREHEAGFKGQGWKKQMRLKHHKGEENPTGSAFIDNLLNITSSTKL